jgi:hypothetical protein
VGIGGGYRQPESAYRITGITGDDARGAGRRWRYARTASSVRRLRPSRDPDLPAAVRVGEAPVGLSAVRGGSLIVVADSNRYGAPGATADLDVVSVARRARRTGHRRARPLPSGSFPREMAAPTRGRGAPGDEYLRPARGGRRFQPAGRLTRLTRLTRLALLAGWPAGRLAGRRRDPVVAGVARRAADAAVGQAQQSEVDNALTAFADAVGGGLPEPWAGGLREAARCNAGMVPQALAGAVQAAVAESRSGPPGWWRLVTAWQWLLAILAAAGIALSVVIAVVRLTGHHQGWISEVSLIPWLLIMTVAMLVLGYVTAVSCRNVAVAAADRERMTAEQAMRDRVAGVTHDLVLLAAGREIAQYERFRRELAVAAGR